MHNKDVPAQKRCAGQLFNNQSILVLHLLSNHEFSYLSLIRTFFDSVHSWAVQPRQIQIAPHRAETQDGSEHVCLDRQLGRNALRYALVRRTLVRWAAWWLHGDAPARSSLRRARLRSAAGLRRYAFRSPRRCGMMGPDLSTWCGVNTEGKRELSSCLSMDTRPGHVVHTCMHVQPCTAVCILWNTILSVCLVHSCFNPLFGPLHL